jgi:hypothetical protein
MDSKIEELSMLGARMSACSVQDIVWTHVEQLELFEKAREKLGVHCWEQPLKAGMEYIAFPDVLPPGAIQLGVCKFLSKVDPLQQYLDNLTTTQAMLTQREWSFMNRHWRQRILEHRQAVEEITSTALRPCWYTLAYGVVLCDHPHVMWHETICNNIPKEYQIRFHSSEAPGPRVLTCPLPHAMTLHATQQKLHDKNPHFPMADALKLPHAHNKDLFSMAICMQQRQEQMGMNTHNSLDLTRLAAHASENDYDDADYGDDVSDLTCITVSDTVAHDDDDSVGHDEHDATQHVRPAPCAPCDPYAATKPIVYSSFAAQAFSNNTPTAF